MFYVYKLLKNDDVIYVGCTSNLNSRLKQHLLKMYDNVSVTPFFNASDAFKFERSEIGRINPKYNTKCRTDGGKAEKDYDDLFDMIELEIVSELDCWTVDESFSGNEFYEQAIRSGISPSYLLMPSNHVRSMEFAFNSNWSDLIKTFDLEKVTGRKI